MLHLILVGPGVLLGEASIREELEWKKLKFKGILKFKGVCKYIFPSGDLNFLGELGPLRTPYLG